MAWTPITLTGVQRKHADRVGGCEIVLPWPEGLPSGKPLAEGTERDATRAEHASAEQIVLPAAKAAGLVPVRSVVAMLQRPNGLPREGAVEQHLVVLLIGHRWVHARGARPPMQSWHRIEAIRRLT